MTISSPPVRTCLLFALSWMPAISQAVTYTVTLDTRPLAALATPPGPFALEFQFNDGGGGVSNTVTLSNFNFGPGGAASGSAITTDGVSGSLSNTVTLTDSAFFNEFIQGFTPSSTAPLSFVLDLTTQLEPITPDTFSLAIFDSSGTGIQTSFFDVFLQIDITESPSIKTFASDPNTPPPGCPTCAPIVIAAPVVPVPVPAPIVLFLSGLSWLLCGARGNKR